SRWERSVRIYCAGQCALGRCESYLGRLSIFETAGRRDDRSPAVYGGGGRFATWRTRFARQGGTSGTYVAAGATGQRWGRELCHVLTFLDETPTRTDGS